MKPSFLFWRFLLFLAMAGTLLPTGPAPAAQTRPDSRIIRAGVLKNWPPHYSLDRASGNPSGFAVELFDEIAEKTGLPVRYLTFEAWPDLLAAVEQGQVDLVPNMGITPDRQRQFDFTPPVEAFNIHIFVRETTFDIRGLEDLEGRRIGVVQRNQGLTLMETFGRGKLEVFSSLERAFLSLISGKVDAMVYPEPNVRRIASLAGLEHRIKIAGPPLSEVKRAIALAKGQPDLLNRLTQAVEQVVATPAYTEIYGRYFKKPEPYWNARRIFLGMAFLLAATILALIFWRYASMLRITAALQETIRLKVQAEKKLLTQQQFLEKAQEIGQIGTWELDLEKNQLTWTGENYRIFGVPQGTPLTYETFLDRVHPEDRGYVDREWKASLDGKPYDIEHRLLVDGLVKWVREKAELAFDDSGRCLRGTGVTQEITARKRIEDALRISESKFRTAFQNSPDAINLNRMEDGAYVEVNNGFTQIMGYTSREVLGKTSLELKIWKDPGDRERLIAGLNRTGSVENLEAEFVAKDGSVKSGLMSASLMTLGGENLIVSITRDYTERKKTEQELARSEAWHRSIIQTAMDGFWVLDSSGKILEVNPTYCQMTGYTQGELLNMNLADLETGETLEETARHLQQVRLKGEDRFETRHRRKDGEIIHVEVQVQYRGDDDGRLVVFIKDITERTRWQERLQQAQKMESIGNLAGGIAHDFNNILFPIIGMAEMLMEDLPAHSPERENAEEIFKAGQRGGGLVKQILAFSRQTEQMTAPTRVQHILKEVLNLARATIPSNIILHQEIQADCGLILADPNQIHQVAMNIITNAYHAMGDSGGTISIRLAEQAVPGRDPIGAGPVTGSLKPGRYAVLSVSDTGHGIPGPLLEKIFDPYFTTKAQGKGTGLGLAVVHGIVKTHDGEITVTSTPGQGSTFTVYLPLMPPSPGPAPAPRETRIPTGHEHILLVDDEAAVAKLESQILQRLGYSVTMHLNSRDALEAFQAAPQTFDAIVSDMTMPQMTGIQLAEEIRALGSDIPILICTGFSERLNSSTMGRFGVTEILMKPIVRADLATALRRALDESGRHA